ncbi:MAG: MMPL family transporter, partial [Firmicutes bacterium]|nr:MMPL family transporter [Bacillota bacterium]
MERVSRCIVKNPWWFIGINTIITLIFAVFALGLVIDDDLTNYLPSNDPVVTAFRSISETFSGSAIGAVMVETDNIFSNDALEHIENLTQSFSRIDGVSSVISLTNVLDMRAEGDMLEVGPLFDVSRGYSPTELAEREDYVMAKDIYAGNLVSKDGRMALITVTLKPKADTQTAVDAMDDILEGYSSSGKFNHYRTGNPFFSVDGDRTAKKDLRTLVPTVVLVVIGVLFLTFRTIKGTLIPLIGVLVSVIWAMGLVAASGQALTTVGIAIPVILVSVGSAYGIHVMNEYYR